MHIKIILIAAEYPKDNSAVREDTGTMALGDKNITLTRCEYTPRFTSTWQPRTTADVSAIRGNRIRRMDTKKSPYVYILVT